MKNFVSVAGARAVALALALFMVPVSGSAGPIKGKITGFLKLVNPTWEEAKSPDSHGYTFREPSPTVRADLRKLYPYIPKEVCIAVLAEAPQPKMRKREVLVGGGRTTPVTLVVTPGTELKFKNTDPFAHRLYGVTDKSFTVANTLKGGDRTWTVPKAGVYEIRDELTPSLRMWIVSEPRAAAITYPSLSGDFTATLADGGRFVVQAYFLGKPAGAAVPVVLNGPNASADISRVPIVVGGKGGK